MKVTGKVRLIGNVQEVGNNGFTKRLIVIDTTEQYSQPIGIDFVKDKTDLLNNFSVGQNVEVSVNLRGNEYNSKFYVSLQGWKIDKSDVSAESTQEQQPTSNEKDNLPF